jgi:hypothetical protein
MRRDWFFVTVLFSATILVLFAAYIHIQRASLVEERIQALTALQERQLELFQGRAAVLLTITTLVIGGAGALLLHFHEHGSGSILQQRFAVVALLAGGVSALNGYFAYDAAIWMLRSQFFNLDTNAVRVPTLGQLWASGAAVVSLVVCFLSSKQSGGKRL